MESDLIHSPSKAAFLVSEINGSSGNASGGMPPGSSLPPRIPGCADGWAVSGGGGQHVCGWTALSAGPAPTGLSSLPARTMGTG